MTIHLYSMHSLKPNFGAPNLNDGYYVPGDLAGGDGGGGGGGVSLLQNYALHLRGLIF